MSEDIKKEVSSKKGNNASEIIDSLLKGMEAVLSNKTVVGEPTKIGDTIIVPLVDISFGVGAGASLAPGKGGGGGGLSGKMSPNAILVIHNGKTRLVNIKNQDSVTKLMDLVPDVLDRFDFRKNKDSMTDSDIEDIAFGEKK